MSSVFSVDAYGATPNNPADDDRPSIQAAVDAAIAFTNSNGQVATVLFSPGGTYHVSSAHGASTIANTGIYMKLVNPSNSSVSGVIIDGQGAEIVQQVQEMHLFHIEDSNRVSIRDLVIDVDPLPYVDGTITAINWAAGGGGVTLDVTVSVVRGVSTASYFSPGVANEWGWLLDGAVPGRPLAGSASHFEATSITQAGAGAMTFSLTNPVEPAAFTVGGRLTYHRRAGQNITLTRSDNCSVSDVTSYGAGGMFVNGTFSHDLNVQDCSLAIRAGRWRSLNGDGVHLWGCNGVTIEGCHMEGISDDGIHIKGSNGFDVLDNVFENKRRHGILLDGDNVPVRSSNGTIAGNDAHYNGGAFFHYFGGAYDTVAFSSNTTSNNNLTLGASTRNVTIAPQNGTTLRVSVAAPLVAGGLTTLAASGAAGTSWNLLAGLPPAQDHFLLCSEDAFQSGSWLYMAPQIPGGGPGYAEINDPNPAGGSQDINDPSQYWHITPVTPGSNTYFVVDENGLYLTAVPFAGSGVLAPGDVVGVANPLPAPYDSYQKWVIQ